MWSQENPFILQEMPPEESPLDSFRLSPPWSKKHYLIFKCTESHTRFGPSLSYLGGLEMPC